MSISIKKDLSKQERNSKKKLLLKERWTLIQAGVSRSDIKICQSLIYVKGNVHDRVIGMFFHTPHTTTQFVSMMK